MTAPTVGSGAPPPPARRAHDRSSRCNGRLVTANNGNAHFREYSPHFFAGVIPASAWRQWASGPVSAADRRARAASPCSTYRLAARAAAGSVTVERKSGGHGCGVRAARAVAVRGFRRAVPGARPPRGRRTGCRLRRLPAGARRSRMTAAGPMSWMRRTASRGVGQRDAIGAPGQAARLPARFGVTTRACRNSLGPECGHRVVRIEKRRAARGRQHHGIHDKVSQLAGPPRSRPQQLPPIPASTSMPVLTACAPKSDATALIWAGHDVGGDGMQRRSRRGCSAR